MISNLIQKLFGLFDKIEWKKYSNDMNRDNPRGQMIEDLFENHLKKEISSAEIIALLGTPDRKNEQNFYSYNLGIWSGLRMDYDSLDLWFDNKERLVSFARVQH